MSNYPDSSPVGGSSKGGRKSERFSESERPKNKDGRLKGSAYDKQCDSSGDGGPGMPQRVASRSAMKTYDPNETAESIAGGKAYYSSRRKGLEEGAY